MLFKNPPMAERGDKAVIEVLCARLGDEDFYVRSSACKALL
jgi:hypothetical protein